MLERMYGITPQEELPPVAPEIPDLSITIQENEQHYGRFVVEPLERGWGVTLGNPLRRSLLNSLPGTAVTWVKVVGALHEYSTIPHMREEVVEFLLNIKGIRIRSLSERPGRLRLEVDGEGEVRAGDIMATADFEIVNPDHHLATLDNADARLSVEFNVEQGVGGNYTFPETAFRDVDMGSGLCAKGLLFLSLQAPQVIPCFGEVEFQNL